MTVHEVSCTTSQVLFPHISLTGFTLLWDKSVQIAEWERRRTRLITFDTFVKANICLLSRSVGRIVNLCLRFGWTLKCHSWPTALKMPLSLWRSCHGNGWHLYDIAKIFVSRQGSFLLVSFWCINLFELWELQPSVLIHLIYWANSHHHVLMAIMESSSLHEDILSFPHWNKSWYWQLLTVLLWFWSDFWCKLPIVKLG